MSNERMRSSDMGKIIAKLYESGITDAQMISVCELIAVAFRMAKSVTQSRGRWISDVVSQIGPHGNVLELDAFLCSECGCHIYDNEKTAYCPDCGAQMEMTDEKEDE